MHVCRLHDNVTHRRGDSQASSSACRFNPGSVLDCVTHPHTNVVRRCEECTSDLRAFCGVTQSRIQMNAPGWKSRDLNVKSSNRATVGAVPRPFFSGLGERGKSRLFECGRRKTLVAIARLSRISELYVYTYISPSVKLDPLITKLLLLSSRDLL